MKEKSLLTTKSLNVSGMHCASCASIIKKKLEKIDGVSSCDINIASEKAKVTFDPNKANLTTLNTQIEKLGYKLTDTETKAHDPHAGHDMMTPVSSDNTVKEQKLKDLNILENKVKIVIPMVLISIFVMTTEIIGMMPENFMEFFHHLMPIFATYTLFAIGSTYLSAVVRLFKHRVANMDSLVGIGTLTAFIYSFFANVIDESLASYYDVTIVVIGFITLGKYLESKSKLRTGEAIEKLLNLQAKMAIVIRDGVEIEIPISEVVIGDIAVVKPGQKIPLDGVVIEGSSAVDESMISGESLPIDKVVGDNVIGATINKNGSLRIEITKSAEDTVLSQIIKMVEDAQGSKAPIERLADQVSAVFVPTVLVIALIVLAVWVILGNPTLGLLSFVGVLIIACPCAMGLATPTAVIVGVGKAAQNGILIKNAENLEKFNTINYVVFDKTGTITNGKPVVTDIKVVSNIKEDKALAIAASLESHSEHPLAEAIVNKAKERNIKLTKTENFMNTEGKGIEAEIGNQKYFIGNISFAEKVKHKIELDIVDQFASQGKTPVILFTKQEVIAIIAIADTIKDNAKETVKELHDLGIKVAMLTGDNKKTANHIASLVGIDLVLAEVMPQDKSFEIKKLQEEGHRVAMVGDGINDAPALAVSDVGVAMGTGTDVAIESAGITLLGGNIAKLPKAISLARSTMSIIKQNLFWAFIYNIIGIPVAAFGLLNPAVAGAAMGLSSVSVVLNSLRLKAKKL